ncbi:MAG: hypothetical protein AAF125_11540, partial [Chloroflexota bacterium]
MFETAAILEVIIGIVFSYILLSLLVSQINTVVANVVNLRAEQLRQRVEAIIFDEDLQKKVLAHPVVGMIQPRRSTDKPVELISAADMETARVSKIAPKTVAQAMINVLSDPFLNLYTAIELVENPDEKEELKQLVNQVRIHVEDPQRSNAALVQLHEAITKLEPNTRRDRRAMLRTLAQLQSDIRSYQLENGELLVIIEGVSRIENRAFQQAMETILRSAATVKQAELAIEDWFDKKMSQTSDWYSTTMQYLSLVIGLLLTLLINVDTIHMTLTLWNDDTLRTTVAATAFAADFSAYIDAQGN